MWLLGIALSGLVIAAIALVPVIIPALSINFHPSVDIGTS
jgi:hypothetical protein